MKYYGVVEVTVIKPSWVGSYLQNVYQIVESYGGRYLARTSEHELVEGEDELHQTTVILEFPSKEKALGFYNSREYTPFREARKNGSRCKFYFVAGEDEARLRT